ncbi:V-type proton ATPase subunit C [Dictyocoela muelleri]|nr:V-type proton ATPase subunit C [Dictyocoela muelleri]
MHLLVGLPIDKKLDDQEILKVLKKDNDMDLSIFKIPSLKWNSLEYMICITEDITGLDKQVNDLFQSLLNRQNDILKLKVNDNFEKNIDYNKIVANFKWNDERYNPNGAPCEIFEILSKDFDKIKSIFAKRSKKYDKAHNCYKENQKKQNGNIMEIDLSNFVEVEECEFIETIFVVARKSDKQKFVADFQKIEHVQHTTLELEKEDDLFVLYKFIGLKSKKNDIEKQLKAMGYTLKSVNKSEKVFEIDFESVIKNFEAFIDAELIELFLVQLHIKYLSLYIESVLRYGLPNDYVYFAVNTESAEKTMKVLQSLAINWPFSERHNPNKNKDLELNSWIALYEISDYGKWFKNK